MLIVSPQVTVLFDWFPLADMNNKTSHSNVAKSTKAAPAANKLDEKGEEEVAPSSESGKRSTRSCRSKGVCLLQNSFSE
jgi:hypothetical protein